MLLNRREQPLTSEIEEINFLKATSYGLKNGAKVHYINQENQSVVKLEVSFEAGTIYQPKPLLAAITNALLIEGSTRYSSSEIAEYFDSEGAFLETSCSYEKASVTLYCLAKSLAILLPRLQEIIFNPAFPEQEISNYLLVNKQKFVVNNEKVGYIAKKEFLPFLIGKENPYGDRIDSSDFENIDQNDLIQFFKSRYDCQPFEIYVSGKVEEKSLLMINESFSPIEFTPNNGRQSIIKVMPTENNELIIERENAIQSAIRIGSLSIGRDHADFPKLYLANTILGGYFGSRLMNNIREDKGYTYGIGSNIMSLRHFSYFVISTEVGTEFKADTIREIKYEMNKMCDENVNSRELALVKNYVLGNIMRGFDGAFSAMDRFIMLNNMGIAYEYYERLVKGIREVSALDIKEMCRTYLQYEKMQKVIVGKI